MKKVFLKYIESLIFLSIFSVLIMLKLNNENSYLLDFSMGKFFYLFLLYFLFKNFYSARTK
jgi:hypothetical protein